MMREMLALLFERPGSAIVLFVVVQVFLRLLDNIVMPLVDAHVAPSLLLLSSCDAFHDVSISEMRSLRGFSQVARLSTSITDDLG
jgi:hypothetical protein